MTNDDVLLIDTHDRVRTLTLNRPQARNALSTERRNRFFAALRDAEVDDDVDVVILTGADPVFCAGLDLKELGDTTELPDISPKWPAAAKTGHRGPNAGAGHTGAAPPPQVARDDQTGHRGHQRCGGHWWPRTRALLRHSDRLGACPVRRHPRPR